MDILEQAERGGERAGTRRGRGPLSWIGRHGAGSLAVLAVAAALLWGFVELADEVVAGDVHATDERILLALRTPGDPDDPLGPPWLEESMRDVTGWGGVAAHAGITAGIAAFLALAGKRRMALFLVAAVAGGYVASILLKSGFDRPRPDLVPHGSYVYTASFPSGHAMLSAVTYLTLGALVARSVASLRLRAYVLGVAVVLTFLVGASRVYLGVHWPSDVLAGWTAGAVWALVCWVAARHLQRRGRVEREGVVEP